MTPEEKALKLVHDMYFAYGEVSMAQAKQCALIAVDEILNYDLKAKTESQFIIERRIEEYWTEVKQEIEKL